VIACRDELVLLTPRGEVVDRITALHGLPMPVSGIALHEGILLLFNGPDKTFLTDLDSLSWQPVKVKISAAQAQALPLALNAQLNEASMSTGITWERVLLDIHAARFLGKAGPWLLDVSALLLVWLALTGYLMWYIAQRKRR
jgi:hypothetical protein